MPKTHVKDKVISFGCRLNQYEGEIIRNISGATENCIVINTCAVTQEAEKKAEKAIRKIKKRDPEANIIVTGCAAQINPQKYADMPGVLKVLGNADKLIPGNYHRPEKIIVSSLAEQQHLNAPQPLIHGIKSKTRVFLEIQNGCDHQCTYCRIPQGRGKSRSTPLGFLVEQIKKLICNDCKELVLTGVDITAYGEDFPAPITLGQAVKRILKLFPELPRLRISSLDVAEVDPTLLEIIRYEPRLMPHIHISLQSGDDIILKRMKRRHNRAQAIDWCNSLRQIRPDITYGADLIVGFPTETDEMFQNSLRLIQDAQISHLHIFPFSPHENTPAARMPQVLPRIIKQRAEIARQVGANVRQALFKHSVGKMYQVLVEGNANAENHSKGYTQNFISTIIKQSIHKGTIATVKITGYNDQSLIGTAQ